MFNLLAHNADTLAYIHGALLILLAFLVFLLGRTQAWSAPSRTLALLLIAQAGHISSRVIRFNTELGRDGAWITHIFSIAALISLIELVRRSRVLTINRKHTLVAAGVIISAITIPPLINIKAFDIGIPMMICLAASALIGLFCINAKHDTNPRFARRFWIGLWIYVLSLFFTPVGTSDINAHLPAERLSLYSAAFVLQICLLHISVGFAYLELRNRFHEIRLQRYLTPLRSGGLTFWIVGSVTATIAIAHLLGIGARNRLVAAHNDGERAFAANLEQISAEAKTRLALIEASGAITGITTQASADKIGASKTMARICEPAESMVCYLINNKGDTIAASNWNKENSFLGKNFGFRDYFRSAVQTGYGEQFAKGVTSHIPGFYAARRILERNGEPFVFVAKSNLPPIIEGFSEQQSLFFIDSDSNILISNDDDALGKRLFSNKNGDQGYLGGSFADHERFLYEGKTAHLRLKPTRFAGVTLANVQIDTEPHFRLLGFALGTPLYFSALMGTLLIILFLLGAQEREDNLERMQRLEKENAETRAMLFHSEKLASLGLLSAGVAHEINNPLTVVATSLFRLKETIEKSGGWEPQQQTLTMLDRAERSTQRITDIVKRLLAFSRVEKEASSAVDVGSVVADVADMLQYTFEKQGINITVKSGNVPHKIRGNSGELGQILLNLLTNAKDALLNHSEGRIFLTIEEQGPNVLIKCADNGPGVPKSIQPKIFDPFFTTKDIGKGTGLGLSISHSIAVSMGGSLAVEESPGGGATFVLMLPKLHDTTS